MSWAAVAGAAITVVGGLASQDAQRSAANKANDRQSGSDSEAIAAQQAQFASIQKLLAPFVTGGTSAFGAQQDLAGLNGADKQKAAIDAIQNSSQFGAMAQQGENAILSNASATGGLRGGNVQGALGQFRPQLLNQLVSQQYERLGGLASIGQNAAAMQGNAGMHSTDMITQLLQSQGAAGAGAALAGGQANAGMIGSLSGAFGQLAGSGIFNRGGNQFTGQNGYTSVDWGIGGGF